MQIDPTFGRPPAEKHDLGGSDAASPDAASPDAASPATASSDTASSDTASSDTASSDTASRSGVDTSSVDPDGLTSETSGGHLARSESGSQESWSLEALEADIAAVGSAMETVDRIVAGITSDEGSIGSAAAEITAVVSHERFGTPGSVIS